MHRRNGAIATPLTQEAAPYVARSILDFDIDAGIGQILIQAPPNANLLITSVGGWGQTADKVYGLGIAPPGYVGEPGQAGKLANTWGRRSRGGFSCRGGYHLKQQSLN